MALENLHPRAEVLQYLCPEGTSNYLSRTKIYDKKRKDFDGRRRPLTEEQRLCKELLGHCRADTLDELYQAEEPAAYFLKRINGNGKSRRTESGLKTWQAAKRYGITFTCNTCQQEYTHWNKHKKRCKQ